MALATIPEALDALRAGKPVLVVDDADRGERGRRDRLRRARDPRDARLDGPSDLRLPLRADAARPRRSARPSADGRRQPGPAVDRVHDLRRRGGRRHDRHQRGGPGADAQRPRRPDLRPEDLIRPGHVLPLRAVDGGVRERAGHTEAAVELMQLAGLPPVGAIGELVTDDGSMMRLPEILELGAERDLPVVTIADLIAFVSGVPAGAEPVQRRACRSVPRRTSRPSTARSECAPTVTRSPATTTSPSSPTPSPTSPLVRVHSECLTGEAFGSLKCECGPQLDTALDAIARRAASSSISAGHEGRRHRPSSTSCAPIGSRRTDSTPSRRTSRSDSRPDRREFGGAARGSLADLGATRVRLMTNNPDKVAQLAAHGIEVVESLPMIVGVRDENRGYLATKRDRLGHSLPSNDELAGASRSGSRAPGLGNPPDSRAALPAESVAGTGKA